MSKIYLIGPIYTSSVIVTLRPLIDFVRQLANLVVRRREEVIQMRSPDCRAASEKDFAMHVTIMEVDQKEEEILAFEVSDEALESAAGTGTAIYTLGACTGLSVCPG